MSESHPNSPFIPPDLFQHSWRLPTGPRTRVADPQRPSPRPRHLSPSPSSPYPRRLSSAPLARLGLPPSPDPHRLAGVLLQPRDPRSRALVLARPPPLAPPLPSPRLGIPPASIPSSRRPFPSPVVTSPIFSSQHHSSPPLARLGDSLLPIPVVSPVSSSSTPLARLGASSSHPRRLAGRHLPISSSLERVRSLAGIPSCLQPPPQHRHLDSRRLLTPSSLFLPVSASSFSDPRRLAAPVFHRVISPANARSSRRRPPDPRLLVGLPLLSPSSPCLMGGSPALGGGTPFPSCRRPRPHPCPLDPERRARPSLTRALEQLGILKRAWSRPVHAPLDDDAESDARLSRPSSHRSTTVARCVLRPFPTRVGRSPSLTPASPRRAAPSAQ